MMSEEASLKWFMEVKYGFGWFWKGLEGFGRVLEGFGRVRKGSVGERQL